MNMYDSVKMVPTESVPGIEGRDEQEQWRS
jgi:hypothetical protein